MNTEIINEAIALLVNANYFTETLKSKRDELVKILEEQLLIHSVVVPEGTLPYDKKCDDACKFYCTKGGTQYPECLK